MTQTSSLKQPLRRATPTARSTPTRAKVVSVVETYPEHPQASPLKVEEAVRHVCQAAHEKTRYFLGGSRFWPDRPESPTAVHEAAVRGVPYGSLTHLVDQVSLIRPDEVAKVLGMSHRTLTRQALKPRESMPADLASKAWQFAEILAKASEVFGGDHEAERWMSAPAVALNGHRPIELLQTVQGAEVVRDYLTRLEFGVYA